MKKTKTMPLIEISPVDGGKSYRLHSPVAGDCVAPFIGSLEECKDEGVRLRKKLQTRFNLRTNDKEKLEWLKKCPDLWKYPQKEVEVAVQNTLECYPWAGKLISLKETVNYKYVAECQIYGPCEIDGKTVWCTRYGNPDKCPITKHVVTVLGYWKETNEYPLVEISEPVPDNLIEHRARRYLTEFCV